MTPLHVAAERGCFKVVKYFVSNGAEINTKDINGVNMCDNCIITVKCEM